MRVRCIWAIAAVVGLAQSTPLGAVFNSTLREVPIDRLVANLEKTIAGEPADALLRVNLARSHAMAYAFKTSTLAMGPGAWRNGAGTGVYSIDSVPPSVVTPTSDPAVLERARTHLRAAIAGYEAALALDPRLSAARLGLAWCWQQAGERERAIAGYRTIIADEFSRDPFVAFPFSETSPGFEAATYLLPLLDRARDKEESARLTAFIEEFKGRPRLVPPVVVPLRHGFDVERLVARDRSAYFDADDTGPSDWTWISADVAWLAFDRRGDGTIAAATQLFGSVSFGMFWRNGYEALRALDDNQDGLLTDDELTGLVLWRDENSNGVSEPGEVKPLAAWGIVPASCRYTSEDESGDYMVWFGRGVTLPTARRDRTFEPSNLRTLEPYSIPLSVLPQPRGVSFGSVFMNASTACICPPYTLKPS